MRPEALGKLCALRADYAQTAGHPFVHFYCPILFRDENVPLCEAHIVNEAFGSSTRQWTIQRQDVDNFYGSMFESEFVESRYDYDGISAQAFVDPQLYRQLQPTILLDGAEVEHFIPHGPVPSQFSEVVLEHEGRTVRIGLKIPGDQLQRKDARWETEVANDLRLPALVSVIKAAHLTLFMMLGYRYALGGGARYVGSILGRFFEANQGRDKREVIRSAFLHFAPFVSMVRPVEAFSLPLAGTIDDSTFLVCWDRVGGRQFFWGGIVFIRTNNILHAALVPIFDDANGEGRFRRFLESEGDTLSMSIGRFTGGALTVERSRMTAVWPPGQSSLI